MKAKEVQIDGVYAVNVGRNITGVRITQENPRGGWDGVNVKTNKPVRIKSAQRLRGPWQRDDKPETPVTSPTAAPGAQTEPETTPGITGDSGTPERKPDGKMSLLDAAAHLLSLDKSAAMNCQDMVDLAVAEGLWQPRKGKTPANTLYAAIAREIKTAGDTSRFAKAEPGKFKLA